MNNFFSRKKNTKLNDFPNKKIFHKKTIKTLSKQNDNKTFFV